MPTINFKIEYVTSWGESLCLKYRVNGGALQTLPLLTADGHLWTCDVEASPYSKLTYTYALCDAGGRTLRTMRTDALSVVVTGRSNVSVVDNWHDRDVPSELLHSAFANAAGADADVAASLSALSEGGCLLSVTVPPLPGGVQIAVCGEGEGLGNWNPASAVVLKRLSNYSCGAVLPVAAVGECIVYKYLLIDTTEEQRRVVWESGENHYLKAAPAVDGASLLIHDEMPRLDFPRWRGAGVVIPVFSLRSGGSQGIGDFGDLRRFVRWAASVGFKSVQILPINDTTNSATWTDSYPYSAISVFALHPAYLDMREWAGTPLFSAYEEQMRELNNAAALDYERVFRLKTEFLYQLYLQIGKMVMQGEGFRRYFRDNEEWLIPYSLFSLQKLRELRYVKADSAAYFHFTQYLLHRQMEAAHDEAVVHGVILKGDIPIGVGRESVPAIVDRRLFHFDGQAGAPPDAFAKKGQNWGFPTYNWDEMAKDGYAWWQRRLRHMSRYFDAYRIDHVLGFFRIWEIPTEQEDGRLGYFRPALPLSTEEIRNSGFTADIKHYAHPFLTAERQRLFVEEFGEPALHAYFCQHESGEFVLRDDFATQRKVFALVPEGRLRDVLLEIICEVLFIADAESGGYHPRIEAQTTDVFNTLSQSDRDAFNRLYDDFFYHRHNAYWAELAMEKLPALLSAESASSPLPMLPCAEDLGMIPASVKGVLERLHILSLEIQRMPKAYGVRFDDLSRNPYLSVSTIATHDMAPLRLWWHEDRGQTQQFWSEVLGRPGEAAEDATPEVCEQVVNMHLKSPSMLCLIALQDYLAIDARLRNPNYEEEQINVPANSHHYWRYRMHLNIEDLENASAFCDKLRGLVTRSGR